MLGLRRSIGGIREGKRAVDRVRRSGWGSRGSGAAGDGRHYDMGRVHVGAQASYGSTGRSGHRSSGGGRRARKNCGSSVSDGASGHGGCSFWGDGGGSGSNPCWDSRGYRSELGRRVAD